MWLKRGILGPNTSRLNKGHNPAQQPKKGHGLVQTTHKGHRSVQTSHRGHGSVQKTHSDHGFFLTEVMTQSKESHKVTTQSQQPQRWSQFNIVGRQPFHPQDHDIPSRWVNNSFCLSCLNKFLGCSNVLFNSLLCLSKATSNEYGIHIPLQNVLGMMG